MTIAEIKEAVLQIAPSPHYSPALLITFIKS